MQLLPFAHTVQLFRSTYIQAPKGSFAIALELPPGEALLLLCSRGIRARHMTVPMSAMRINAGPRVLRASYAPCVFLFFRKKITVQIGIHLKLKLKAQGRLCTWGLLTKLS